MKQAAILSLILFSVSIMQIHGSDRPNILYIIADDMELTDLGCYGGKLPTPNLDRLAQEGIAFTSHYPTATVCAPSRYTLMTGQYPSTAASVLKEHPSSEPPMIRWNTFIEKGQTTLGTLAKQKGYDTAFVGKWHNGHPELDPIPLDADPNAPDVQKTLARNHETMQAFVREHGGFDYAGGIYTENVHHIPAPEELKGHNQHWFTHEAVKFLQETRENPFLMYFATTLPHPPHVVDSLQADPRATVAGLRSEHLNTQPSYESVLKRLKENGPYPEDYDPFVKPYARSEAAGILWLDDAVGRLLDELEIQGKLDDTFILFAADHDRRGKMVLNRAQCPLIIRYPKIKRTPNVLSHVLVSNADFLPTACELMGFEANSDLSLPGKSMLPYLMDETESIRDSVYLEITYTRAVIQDGYKYIATRYPETIANTITSENRTHVNQEGRQTGASDDPDGNFVRYNSQKRFPNYFADDQLYNLSKDPEEQINLVDSIDHQSRLKTLKQLLSAYSSTLPHQFGEFTAPPKAQGQ